MLKFVYTFFLGLLLVLFVGLGVATFYTPPKAPTYPQSLQEPLGSDQEYTHEQKHQQDEWQTASDKYGKELDVYNRNVSIIVLVAAVVMLVVSLVFQSRIEILADGLLMGGTFTLLYSIGRSFSSNDNRYSFVVVTIGLVLTMTLGYLKFIKPQIAGDSGNKKKN